MPTPKHPLCTPTYAYVIDSKSKPFHDVAMTDTHTTLYKSSALCQKLEAQAQANAKNLPSVCLAVVHVLGDKASALYVQKKLDLAHKLGLQSKLAELPANVSQTDLEKTLKAYADDEDVDGILLQLPLPASLNAPQALACIPPIKDVDGLTLENIGRLESAQTTYAKANSPIPCTPLGIMRLLQTQQVAMTGKHAVVVGCSNLVGRPIATLLLQAGATVTRCHKKTTDLASHTRNADILVVAAGVKNLITPDHIKQGVCLIDVGIHVEDGHVVGDCQSTCAPKASLQTAVPGGVGPLTVISLITNTIDCAYRRRGHPLPKWL